MYFPASQQWVPDSENITGILITLDYYAIRDAKTPDVYLRNNPLCILVCVSFFVHVSSWPLNPLSDVQLEKNEPVLVNQSSMQHGNITDLSWPDCGRVRDCPLIHLHPLAKYQK